MAYDRIIARLDAAQLPYRVHEHAPVRTLEDAHALAPHLTAYLLKTIAFELDGHGRFVLAAIASAARVDYKQLAASCGCGRRHLRLLPAARIEAEVGFEIGGLGPFPLNDRTDIVIDAAVMAWPFVRCGAGLRTRTLELTPTNLVQLTQARVVPIGGTALDRQIEPTG